MLHALPLAALLGCAEATETDPPTGGASGGQHSGMTQDGGDDPTSGSGGTAGGTGGSGAGGHSGHAGASVSGGQGGSGGTAAADPDDGGIEAGAGGAGAGGAGGAGGGDPLEYPTLQAELIGEPVSVLSGFTLAESPLWDHCGEQLLFTDVQGGTGSAGVIHTLSASDELGVLMSSTDNTNGIALDIDGSLILSQMGAGGHLARRDRSGDVQLLEPEGSPNLHTPDDTIVRSDGTIYFSDGDFAPIGSLFGYASTLPVYILKPGATELENGGTVSGPNGLEFSPDEQTLYVSAYGGDAVVKFAVAADGSLTKGDVLISNLPSADSLCVDAAGNIYIGSRDGLEIVRPNGEEVKLIPIPGGSLTTGTTSCTFGGSDGKTLYITSWTTLYRITDMPIPGNDYLVNRDRAHCAP